MTIIADLIRAGVDPELVQRVHEAIISGGYPPSAALATGHSESEVKASLGPPGGAIPDHTREATQASLRSAQNRRYYQRRRILKTAETHTETTESVAKKGSLSSPLYPPLQTTPPIIPQTLPPKKARASARTKLDAEPISFDLDFARQKGLTSDEAFREFEQFADHHRKLGSLMADWQAAWRTWVRNAIKFQARAGPAGRSNGVRGFLENVSRMMADGTDSRTESRNGSSHQGVLGLPERR